MKRFCDPYVRNHLKRFNGLYVSVDDIRFRLHDCSHPSAIPRSDLYSCDESLFPYALAFHTAPRMARGPGSASQPDDDVNGHSMPTVTDVD